MEEKGRKGRNQSFGDIAKGEELKIQVLVRISIMA
tara:strand:+ start:111 stop:215 length:105 start_codon:yes stop_codon:yes gene_type:complete